MADFQPNRWMQNFIEIGNGAVAQALQHSEERALLAIDAARMGTCDWNITTGEIVWNDAHIQMLGYVPGESAYGYEDWERRVHPDDLARVTLALDRAMADRTDYTAEYRVIWADGSLHWIEGFGRFYYDGENRASRMTGLAIDITDRKRTELSLQQSEERLKLAIAAARLGTVDFDLLTDTVIWNDLGKRLMGYDSSITVMHTFTDFERRIHPADASRVLAELARSSISQPDASAEYRVVWADGSIHWHRGFARFYFDGEGRPVRMFGTFEDITDRKQTELALQKSEERLNTTIDAARVGTFDWDLLAHRVVWNEYHRRLLGYPPDIAASYTAWANRVEPEDLARVRSAVQLARDTRTDYACEYRIRWEDGRVRWLEAWGKFYYADDGQPQRMTGVVNDITDRKQIELQLQQSEQRYRALTAATSQLVWSTRADGHVEVEQPTWGAFTGQSFGEYRGWGWLDAIHPEDRARTDELWVAALTSLTTYEIEHRLRRADGEYRLMSARAIPILAADGSVREWVGAHTDITDRKRDEANLRRSEEFNRRILENNKDCIKVLDLDGRLIYMNDGGKQLMEIDDFALVDRAIWVDFWGETDRVAANLAWEAAKMGRVGKFEGRCPTARGKPKWWQVTVAPMFADNGPVEQILAISHDITDRIESESAMRESEDRFRTTFEQVAVGVAHVALDGRWLFVNQQLCEIVGYTAAELMNLTFQDITYPADLATDLEYIRQLIAGEIATYTMEKRYIRKQGDLVWIDLTVSLRRDLAGTPLYLISAIDDISDRKQAEFALHDQAVKLAKTTALAELRNQELDRFTHIVSHDLKAPLRAIANLAEWIEEDLGEAVEPEIQQHLELMRSRVYRMEGMINGLLTYARVGTTAASIETFSVEDLLAQIVDSLSIPSSFTIEWPSGLPPITTNRLLLDRVLANLIGNAWKHHDRSGGCIRIAAQPQSELWEFSVTDDGAGIPPENHQRVFEIFQTLAGDKKDSTGIGLSIVKKIVESQGGTISIDSPSERGTTFRFTWTVGN